jgi:hypothetical protein
VLDTISLGRQDLGQQALEQGLAESPAHLRSPEDLLEPGDVPADLLHAACGLAEGAELTVDLGDGPRGLVEALSHRLLGVLHQRHAVLQTPVHFRRDLLELHRDSALELPEALPDLAAEAGHLLVHGLQRGVLTVPTLAADGVDLALEDREAGIEVVGPGGVTRASDQDPQPPDGTS